MFCLRRQDLADKTKLEACARISQQRSKFESQFSAGCSEIPVLDFSDLDAGLALLLKFKESPGHEVLLDYFANAPIQNYRNTTATMTLVVGLVKVISYVLDPSVSVSGKVSSLVLTRWLIE